MKYTNDRDYYQILILRTIGNFLIISSIFMIGKTFYMPIREEARYFIEKSTNKSYTVVANSKEAKEFEFKLQEGKVSGKGGLAMGIDKKVEVMVPIDTQFGIVIPKIAANSKVIANVDTGDSQSYLEALKGGVAHAAGSAFPGEGGHVYLFAHSTDNIWNVGTYNAVFYLLYKLEVGDEVDIFYQGQRFTYKVTGKEIIDPEQVDYLTRKTDREFITLQTCWPPGTTLKRQLVFAERVVE